MNPSETHAENERSAESHRARFTISRSDCHFAGLVETLRELDKHDRSNALLSVAEGILGCTYKPPAPTFNSIRELQTNGGISVSFSLTPKSHRYRLLRKRLAVAKSFTERNAIFVSVIEPPHMAALEIQLNHGKGLQSIVAQDTHATTIAKQPQASAVQQELPESEQQHSFTNMRLGKPAKSHKELMKGMCLSIVGLANKTT